MKSYKKPKYRYKPNKSIYGKMLIELIWVLFCLATTTIAFYLINIILYSPYFISFSDFVFVFFFVSFLFFDCARCIIHKNYTRSYTLLDFVLKAFNAVNEVKNPNESTAVFTHNQWNAQMCKIIQWHSCIGIYLYNTHISNEICELIFDVWYLL